MKNETKSFLSLFEKIAPKTAKYHDNQLEFYKKTLKTKLDLAFTFQEKKDIIINEIDKVKSSEAASEFEEVYSIDIPTFIQYFQNIQQMAKSMPNAIKKKLDSQDQKIVNLLSKEFDLSKLLDLTEVVESDESKIKEFVFEMQNISKGSEEIGSIEKELIQNANDLMNNLDQDFDLENFGGVLSYKLKKNILHFLHEEIVRLANPNLQCLDSISDPILNENGEFEPMPKGYTLIEGTLKPKQIIHFFTFLTTTINGSEKSFLTENQFRDFIRYGVAIPNKPRTPLIRLNFSAKTNEKTFIYFIYKFYVKHCYNKHSKEDMALFLKHNFINFESIDVIKLAKKFRGDKVPVIDIKVSDFLP